MVVIPVSPMGYKIQYGICAGMLFKSHHQFSVAKRNLLFVFVQAIPILLFIRLNDNIRIRNNSW